MSLNSHWAKPEPGFDSTRNEVVSLMYSKSEDRPKPAVDLKGQRAPPVQERIDALVQDFVSYVGREPTAEEKKHMEDTQIKCSGWLEGLKIDLEGKDSVPIQFFNRLVDEQENMILFVAQDRVRLDAENENKLMQRDYQIVRLNRELEAANEKLDSKDGSHQTHSGSLEKEIQKLKEESRDYAKAKKANVELEQRLKHTETSLRSGINRLEEEVSANAELERGHKQAETSLRAEISRLEAEVSAKAKITELAILQAVEELLRGGGSSGRSTGHIKKLARELHKVITRGVGDDDLEKEKGGQNAATPQTKASTAKKEKSFQTGRFGNSQSETSDNHFKKQIYSADSIKKVIQNLRERLTQLRDQGTGVR
jgi:myosin heavy subunit